MGKLFEEWICTSWAKVEQFRLTWHRNHQKTLRAEMYQGVRDAVDAGTHTCQARLNDFTVQNIVKHICVVKSNLRLTCTLLKSILTKKVLLDLATSNLGSESYLGQALREAPAIYSKATKMAWRSYENLGKLTCLLHLHAKRDMHR